MRTLVKLPIQSAPNERKFFLFIEFKKSALSKISVSFTEFNNKTEKKVDNKIQCQQI